MTSNLAIALIQENQNQKATTANDAVKALDGCLAGEFTQAMADADQTPAGASVLQAFRIVCTGALTADRNLILPKTVSGQTVRKLYMISNTTTGGFNIVVKMSSGATITVGNGKTALVYTNGTDTIRVTADV